MALCNEISFQNEKLSKTANELRVKIVHEEICPGDMYLAFGPSKKVKLLTCKENMKVSGFIVPEEKYEYCYNTSDCRKIVCL